AKDEPLTLLFEERLLDVRVERPQLLGGISRASFAEGLLIDVGGVDLDPIEVPLLAKRLAEKDRGRVRLLTGGRARAPDSNVAGLGDDPGDDVLGQVIPCLGITEKLGDIDQDLVEQDRELFGMHLEVVVICAEVVDAELHAPLGDPPHQAGTFVARKVEPPRVAEKLDQALEIAATFEFQSGAPAATSITSLGAIASNASTKSTTPVLIAAPGIPKNSEEPSSCA